MKIMNMFLACAVLAFAACDSDDDTKPGGGSFPENTEWVGTLDRSGYQFAPPASLQFRDNKKLVL